jgi:hypothetical protein
MAVGTGIGIEVRKEDLRVTIVRLRPSGPRLVAAATIARYRERPATEWGAEYAEFLRCHGASHLAAMVLLPRREAVVRQLALPGVSKRDLPAAIALQADSLHPFPEGEAVWDWARLGESGAVLLGITRRPTIERHAAMFAEAGVKVSGLTFSSAALYSALRLPGLPPPAPFVALGQTEDGLEVYGESAARPIFSGNPNLPIEKAADLAAAELRLPEGTEALELGAVLPGAGSAAPEDVLAYAAGLAGACPWRPVSVNLLPVEQRSSGSRAIFIPTAALAVLLLMAVGLWAAITPFQQGRYLMALEAEIAQLGPVAARAASLDRSIETGRARARLLDDFRRRSKVDLDTLRELTRLLAAPTWLSQLDLGRDSINLAGETEQAGPLLKALDDSPLLRNSEFTVPLARSGKNEVFRIRVTREGVSQ